MITVTCLLGLAAFVGTLVSAYGKVPLWVPVLLLAICEMIRCMPLR